jgi:DNA-binding NtrC family response regulator
LLLLTENEQAHVFTRHLLTSMNWRLCSSFSIDDAENLMARAEFPVVLCDNNLSDGSWQQLLQISGVSARPPRVIVFSRSPDDALWAEVLNLGAYDLLTYPFEAQEVVRVIGLAAESWTREAPRHRREPAPAGYPPAMPGMDWHVSGTARRTARTSAAQSRASAARLRATAGSL